MPNIKHVVTTDYKPTFRTQKVAGLFDVLVEEKLTKYWDINCPIEEKDWQIGLIIGASGSGKTTLSKKIFDEKYYHNNFEWGATNILDDFSKDLNIIDITNALSHVGFSSPPAWLLPYAVLSNGQRFRAEIARCLLEQEELIVFDEFTSVIDRTVAKVASCAVNKYIKKSNKKFVAVSCHYDIEEWLQPDWVLDVSSGEFKWGCLSKPKFKLEISQCHRKAWRLFEGHHYLTATISPAATCFIATLEDEPVAFTSCVSFPHPKLLNYWRGHRTVVLPDYQGVGIGNKLSEWLGNHLYEQGKILISTTSHPAMIGHRINSPNWVLTRAPSHVKVPMSKHSLNASISAKRLSCSFKYIGIPTL